jgi:WD40 repeat protein
MSQPSLHNVFGYNSHPQNITFNQNDELLYSAGKYIVNSSNLGLKTFHSIHSNIITALAVNDARDLFASGDDDGVVCVWSLPSSVMATFSSSIKSITKSLAFSDNNRLLCMIFGCSVAEKTSVMDESKEILSKSVYQEHNKPQDHVKVFDWSKEQIIFVINLEIAPIGCLFIDDHVIGVYEKHLQVWKCPSGDLAGTCTNGTHGFFTGVAKFSDSSFICSTSDGYLSLWRGKTNVVARHGHLFRITCLHVTNDNIYSCDEAYILRFWSKSLIILGSYDIQGFVTTIQEPITSVSSSQSSSKLILSSKDGVLIEVRENCQYIECT